MLIFESLLSSETCIECWCDDVEVIFDAPTWARLSRAACKWDGNVRPRFAARRKIPAAARGLKKNLCGTWLSKTTDNEHSLASLGHVEISAVEHTPRYPIPALDHENAEHFCKVSSFVATEKSGNILENKPSGSKFLQDSRKVIKESSAFASETFALPGDGDVLARDAGRDAIDELEIPGADAPDVAEPFDFRPVAREDLATELFFFDLPNNFAPRLLEAKTETFDA